MVTSTLLLACIYSSPHGWREVPGGSLSMLMKCEHGLCVQYILCTAHASSLMALQHTKSATALQTVYHVLDRTPCTQHVHT